MMLIAPACDMAMLKVKHSNDLFTISYNYQIILMVIVMSGFFLNVKPFFYEKFYISVAK